VSLLRYEHGDGLQCEFGHRLYKIYEPGQKYAHRLLCPTCDKDIIQALEKEMERTEYGKD
jgi:hypothetical protein